MVEQDKRCRYGRYYLLLLLYYILYYLLLYYLYCTTYYTTFCCHCTHFFGYLPPPIKQAKYCIMKDRSIIDTIKANRKKIHLTFR